MFEGKTCSLRRAFTINAFRNFKPFQHPLLAAVVLPSYFIRRNGRLDNMLLDLIITLLLA
jgi:hypothetical protein